MLLITTKLYSFVWLLRHNVRHNLLAFFFFLLQKLKPSATGGQESANSLGVGRLAWVVMMGRGHHQSDDWWLMKHRVGGWLCGFGRAHYSEAGRACITHRIPRGFVMRYTSRIMTWLGKGIWTKGKRDVYVPPWNRFLLSFTQNNLPLQAELSSQQRGVKGRFWSFSTYTVHVAVLFKATQSCRPSSKRFIGTFSNVFCIDHSSV